MAVNTFKANQAKSGAAFVISGTGTVSQTFARNVATVDPDDDAVGANVARRDRPLLIAAVPQVQSVYAGTGKLLASGVDSDGATALLVHGAYWVNKVVVWAGDPLVVSPNETALATHTVGPNSMPSDPNGDQRYFSSIDFDDGEFAFEPLCAVVIHGMIILGGCAWKRVSKDTYELEGWAFVKSTQQGAPGSWVLLWDDTALSPHTQVHNPRGREWVMKAAPIYQRGQAHPTHCAVVCGDYVIKDQSIGQAASGRAYYFRVARSGTTATDWDAVRTGGGAAMVKFFNIWPGQPGINGLLNHVHCVMATEWNTEADPGGVQLLISTGDGPEHNRLIRARMGNYLEDYTDDTKWTITDFYHGTADVPASGIVGVSSPQPWNALFGAREGEILWSADYGSEYIFRTILPTDNTNGEAQFEHLYGFSSGIGHLPRVNPEMPCFTQEYPERTASNHVAACFQLGDPPQGLSINDTQRILYCPDIAAAPPLWAQVHLIRGAGNDRACTSVTEEGGSYIYFSSWTTSVALARIALPKTGGDHPTLVQMRPVLVGCGGENLVHTSYLVTSAHASPTVFSALGRTAGAWVDTFDGRTLPAAPTLSERLVQIRNVQSATDGLSGTIRVSTDSSTWDTEWQSGTRVRRVRGYNLDGTYERSGLITPNKLSELGARMSDEGNDNDRAAPSMYSCWDRWAPMVNISRQLIDQNRSMGLLLQARSDGDGSTLTNNNVTYYLLDMALDGNGAIPYPLKTLDPNNPGQNVGPDEHLALSVFSLGSTHDWHIKLALMMPTGNWDFTCARESSPGSGISDRIWPLFTLWKDSTHYIEFLADCENSRCLVRIRNGSGAVSQVPFAPGNFWLPDAPLFVAFSYNSTSHALTLAASLGCGQVQTYTVAAFVPGSAYDALKFRGAIGGYSNDGEVCELRVFGGQIDTASGVDVSAAFADLAFLL